MSSGPWERSEETVSHRKPFEGAAESKSGPVRLSLGNAGKSGELLSQSTSRES